MFDRLRKALSGSGDSGPGDSGSGNNRPGNNGPGNSGAGNSGAGNSGAGNRKGPPNLAAVPAIGPGVPGGLAGVDPAVIGAYVGLPVASVGPLSRLGPEATGLFGHAIQERLRARGIGGDGLEPGEMIAGQNAARVARMRAQGVPEEHIRMIQARLAANVAQHQASGWTVVFADGTRASIVVSPAGDDGQFALIQSRFRTQYQHSNIDDHDDLWETDVDNVRDAPYECYFHDGELVARGRRYEVTVQTGLLHTYRLKETLAALAAMALRSID